MVYLILRCHKKKFRISLSTTASVRAGIPSLEIIHLRPLIPTPKCSSWLCWWKIRKRRSRGDWGGNAPAGHHLLALNDGAYLEERWKPFVLEWNVHPEFHLICRLDYSPITDGGPWWCHLPKSQASISRNLQIYLESVLTLPSINTPSLRFIHRILCKLTIALNLSGPVTAACPQTGRLLCNIYQGLLPLRRGFITELLIYKNEAQN